MLGADPGEFVWVITEDYGSEGPVRAYFREEPAKMDFELIQQASKGSSSIYSLVKVPVRG